MKQLGIVRSPTRRASFVTELITLDSNLVLQLDCPRPGAFGQAVLLCDIQAVRDDDAQKRDKKQEAKSYQSRGLRLAAGPLKRLTALRGAAGPDRLVLLVPPQVLGQILRAGVAPGRITIEALQADSLQLFGQAVT